MKRLLPVLLVLALLITGCANTEEPETTVTAPTVADPGLYLPGSAAEQQTGGAVKLVAPEQAGWHTVAALGDGVLLVSGKEESRLQLLSGENCVIAATATLPVDFSQAGQVLDNGVAYFDAATSEAVFLDRQLSEFKRLALPAGVEGNPVFSPDGAEIFYCIDQEIRGMDTAQGLSRLIKSHSCEEQKLTGIFFDGKLLRCDVTDAMWKHNILYISSENGATVSSDKNISLLDTYEDSYLLQRMDGTVQQQIVGTMDAAPMALNVREDMLICAAQLGGVAGATANEAGLHISFYDTSTGRKTAAVTVTGAYVPIAIAADHRSGSVWLLAENVNGQVLLRWQPDASAVAEEATYTGPVFTAQAPDKSGLEALQKRVDALNRQHGTAIRIWDAAVKTTGGNALEAEYQTEAIGAMLDQLEQVLTQFPESFLSKSVNTKIRICIVRTAQGKCEALRFWDDGDPFVVLPCGTDVNTEFMRAMGYIVDSHILGNSPIYDQWLSLNPAGFAYGEQGNGQLLEGENRAFADEASMTVVTEDRARIFYEAMQPDNAAMFQSEIMQSKLLLMCRGIRDAWRWEQKTETYPWEQYLSQSIAYVK